MVIHLFYYITQYRDVAKATYSIDSKALSLTLFLPDVILDLTLKELRELEDV